MKKFAKIGLISALSMAFALPVSAKTVVKPVSKPVVKSSAPAKTAAKTIAKVTATKKVEAKATTAKVATDSVAGTSEVLEHPLLSKQFRSLYWPLQMGQPIKSLNFCQQQCKCNKRQLGEEAKPSPSIQMH